MVGVKSIVNKLDVVDCNLMQVNVVSSSECIDGVVTTVASSKCSDCSQCQQSLWSLVGHCAITVVSVSQCSDCVVVQLVRSVWLVSVDSVVSA